MVDVRKKDQPIEVQQTLVNVQQMGTDTGTGYDVHQTKVEARIFRPRGRREASVSVEKEWCREGEGEGEADGSTVYVLEEREGICDEPFLRKILLGNGITLGIGLHTHRTHRSHRSHRSHRTHRRHRPE